MNFFKIKKRNGSFVTFDKSKIEKAIKKSIESVGGEDFSEVPQLTKSAIDIAMKKLGK
jgi:hypothetical protein